MKAVAAFPESRSVRLLERSAPEVLAPGELLVGTLEVGVCGTDGELCAFHFGYPPPGEEYLVLGHEAVGVVEEVGPGVEDFEVGDLVVPSVRRPCTSDRCPACRSGNQDYCVSGEYTERGIFGAHGFLSEQIVEEARYLFGVPPELRDVAVLTEPLTIAEKGLRQYAAVQRRLPWLAGASDEEILVGRRALVLGAGPVGVLAAMLLRQRGCEVTVYSREESSSERALLLQEAGARYLSADDSSVAEVAEAVGGIELVYEAAGSAALSLAVVEVMAPNGVFILTGATGGGGRLDVGADSLLNRMVGRNLVIAGTVNACHLDFVAAIADLSAFRATWPYAISRVITSRHTPEEFADRALHRRGIKQIIDFSGVR